MLPRSCADVAADLSPAPRRAVMTPPRAAMPLPRCADTPRSRCRRRAAERRAEADAARCRSRAERGVRRALPFFICRRIFACRAARSCRARPPPAMMRQSCARRRLRLPSAAAHRRLPDLLSAAERRIVPLICRFVSRARRCLTPPCRCDFAPEAAAVMIGASVCRRCCRSRTPFCRADFCPRRQHAAHAADVCAAAAAMSAMLPPPFVLPLPADSA